MAVRTNIGGLRSFIQTASRMAEASSMALSSLTFASTATTVSDVMQKDKREILLRNPIIMGIHRIGDKEHFVI